MSQPILISPLKVVQWFEDALAAEGIDLEVRKRIRNRFLWGDPAGPAARPIVLCPECRAESVGVEQLAGAERSCGPGMLEIRYQPCGHRTRVPARPDPDRVSVPTPGVHVVDGLPDGAVMVVAPLDPDEVFDPRRHAAKITGIGTLE